MARKKAWMERESRREPLDLETLLRMSYDFMTTKFLTLAGYSEKEAEELYERYSAYRSRIDGIGEALGKCADAMKDLRSVETR